MKSHTSNALTALILFVGALLSAAPANAASITLTGTVGGSVGSPVVLLQWRATPSGSSYQVFRDGRLFATLGAVSQYTDAKVSAGQTHAYTLAGWGRPLLFPVYSNTVTVPLPAPRPSAPAAPTGLAATGVWGGTSGLPAGPAINLIWQPSAGAASYSVYRNGALLQSGLTRTQAADLTAGSGQTYAYAVTAVGPGGESAKSAAVSATAPNPPAPAAPTGLTAHAFWEPDCAECSHMAMPEIDLAWTATSGATGYKVYRNGTLLQAGLTGPAFEDMTTASGQTYAYVVTAVGPGGEGAPSASASATAPNPPTGPSGMTLTAPTNVTARGVWNSGATDLLSWDAVPGAAGYNVYQYDTLIAKGVTGTSFLVMRNLFNGSMTYTVTAVDAMGMESLPSAPTDLQGAQDPTQQPSWVPGAPMTPINLTSTSEWNAGLPRIHLTWQALYDPNYQLTDYTYTVYRDGKKVAANLWSLNYFDNSVKPGETHTYTVTGVNIPWTTAVESAPSAAASATAPSAAPSAVPGQLQITGVQAQDDSAIVSFAAVPGAVDYRVYDASNPNSVKYSGGGLSVQMNGLNPATGANLVVEALDKLGPFQKMDGSMGPGAMHMDGTMSSAVNGQGDPSNVPNVMARSDTFHVTLQAQGLSGSQVFFDNFRNEQPLVPMTLAAAITASPYTSGEDVGFENDKWQFVNYGTDTAMTKLFFMGNHFMDTVYDGPTAATHPFSHNNNASVVMTPKATADISGGRVVHVTFEVDAHFDGRRWCDVIIAKPGDPIIHPGKFAQTDGGDNYPTVSGDAFRWEIRAGAHDAEMFHAGTDTDLMQISDWNDGQTVARSTWDGKPVTEGTIQDLDKRSRFDLYLSQTRFRIVETTPDGAHTIVRDKQFPAGTVLPFTQCQVYFVHQLYHTGNDRPEQLLWSGGTGAYWYDYRPYSDERHWDNMGQEVLNAFPAFTATAQ